MYLLAYALFIQYSLGCNIVRNIALLLILSPIACKNFWTKINKTVPFGESRTACSKFKEK
jgi:hypothetical protein